MAHQAVGSFKLVGSLALTAWAAVGCGGGGGDEALTPSGTGSAAYVRWVDSANGDVVVDADNEQYRVAADGRQIEDRSGKQARGMTVDGDARILVNGRAVGSVQLVEGTSGVRIAAFKCNDGRSMDITFQADNTYSYACAGADGGSPGGAGAGAGTGAPDAAGYLSFNGSANGTVVLDSDNERFQVAADTRAVVDRSGVRLSGLTVDAGGNVLRNGSSIGGVVLSAGANGASVAVFRCNNGTGMDLTVGVDGWGHACGSSGATDGGNNGGGSGGGTRSFITWNGSANGDVVVDASDDLFKFNSSNGCLYSVNRDTEYGNFCLASADGFTVNFNGTRYTVTRIRSTTNTCITGLLTADGYYADIVTGSDRVDSISTSAKRPASC